MKYELDTYHVEFLGYVITPNNSLVYKKRVQVITDWSTPQYHTMFASSLALPASLPPIHLFLPQNCKSYHSTTCKELTPFFWDLKPQSAFETIELNGLSKFSNSTFESTTTTHKATSVALVMYWCSLETPVSKACSQL